MRAEPFSATRFLFWTAFVALLATFVVLTLRIFWGESPTPTWLPFIWDENE